MGAHGQTELTQPPRKGSTTIESRMKGFKWCLLLFVALLAHCEPGLSHSAWSHHVPTSAAVTITLEPLPLPTPGELGFRRPTSSQGLPNPVSLPSFNPQPQSSSHWPSTSQNTSGQSANAPSQQQVPQGPTPLQSGPIPPANAPSQPQAMVNPPTFAPYPGLVPPPFSGQQASETTPPSEAAYNVPLCGLDVPANPAVWENWSSPATWGAGGVPQPDGNVEIGCGKYVVLDVPAGPNGAPSVVLNFLNVSGALRFSDDVGGIHVAARWIIVHGSLLIGTPEQHFRCELAGNLREGRPGQGLLRNAQGGSLRAD